MIDSDNQWMKQNNIFFFCPGTEIGTENGEIWLLYRLLKFGYRQKPSTAY